MRKEGHAPFVRYPCFISTGQIGTNPSTYPKLVVVELFHQILPLFRYCVELWRHGRGPWISTEDGNAGIFRGGGVYIIKIGLHLFGR